MSNFFFPVHDSHLVLKNHIFNLYTQPELDFSFFIIPLLIIDNTSSVDKLILLKRYHIMTLIALPVKTTAPLQQEQVPTSLTATFTGEDNPCAVNNILSVSSLSGVSLIDLRHTVVQKRLTLVIELEVSSSSRDEAILYKSLLSAANSLSLRVDFEFSVTDKPKCIRSPASPAPSYLPLQLSSMCMPNQYVLTLLSPTSIQPHFLTRVAKELAKHGLVVENISRLSSAHLRCLELIVGATTTLTPTSVANVRKELFAMGRSFQLDVALQAESVMRRSKRLVVFDMDSTLIQQEVIDELARYAGVYDKVCEITHLAMTGKIDFRQSLAERCKLLKGASTDLFEQVIANLQYTKGVKLLCRTLKRLGYRLAVISGGFTRVTAHVRNELGLDYDYANKLEEVDGRFTGNTVGPIVTARRKADLLMTIAQLENITLDQVIAIGDGANDLPMLSTAGVGIAFNAKPAVQEAARFRLNNPNAMTVLYLLGFTEQDQEELSGWGNLKKNGSVSGLFEA